MKTIKIYLAPYVDKIHKEVVNSDGQPFMSKRYVTVPSKKNSQTPIVSKATGKSFIKQSEQFTFWNNLTKPIFLQERQRIAEMGINLPIVRAKMKIIFYFPNHMVRDLTNKSESLMDSLWESGIIYDDMFQVSNKVYLEGYICKDKPRTEIYIHIIEPTSDEYEVDKTNYDRFKVHQDTKRKMIRDWKKS